MYDDLSRLSDDQLRDELYEISKEIAADWTLPESRRAAAARRVAEIDAGSFTPLARAGVQATVSESSSELDRARANSTL
jgi:hypothetical protein